MSARPKRKPTLKSPARPEASPEPVVKHPEQVPQGDQPKPLKSTQAEPSQPQPQENPPTPVLETGTPDKSLDRDYVVGIVVIGTAQAAIAVVESWIPKVLGAVLGVIAAALLWRGRWSKLHFLSKLSTLIVVLLSVFLCFRAVPSILEQFEHTPTAAEIDAETLNSLRAGSLLGAFQKTLGTEPTTVLRTGIILPGGAGLDPLSDRIFLLPTVYVEAFVGPDDIVKAYTITARAADMPQGIRFLDHTYNFGKTTLGSAGIGRITDIAGVCGAHIVAYYETSDFSEATLNQRVAVGLTSSGALPTGYQFPLCPIGNYLNAPFDKAFPASTDGPYTIAMRNASPEYLVASAELRDQMIVNALTITAPGWPVLPEMISLHPEQVALVNGGG